MSSVCDSSVNASRRVPEEMQSVVALAHLTHPSAHAPTMQHCMFAHRALMGYGDERRGGKREESGNEDAASGKNEGRTERRKWSRATKRSSVRSKMSQRQL